MGGRRAPLVLPLGGRAEGRLRARDHLVADLDATAEAITGRGIEPTELEDYGEARKYVFHDPDGNEIGIGQVPAT